MTYVFNISGQSKIPPRQPKLVVGIVIDQMRADYLNRFWENLSDDGFKRLITQGTNCTNTQYTYTFSQSGPDHATIATGTTPGYHGIISKSWYQRKNNLIIPCYEDQGYTLIGIKDTRPGNSAKNLASSTLGDEMKLFSLKESKVISLALNAEQAISMGGHAADAVIWLDEETGKWVTSNYFQAWLPTWCAAFNNEGQSESYISKKWELLKNPAAYSFNKQALRRY